MLTVQTNIALQLVASLSAEEKQAFAIEFEKIVQPFAKTKPKKTKSSFMPDPSVLAAQKLTEWRHKNKTTDAN